MYGNYYDNCYYSNNYSTNLNDLNHCCHYQPSTVPLNCCQCQYYCYYTINSFPSSYRKLSSMPTKLNTTSETFSSKNSAKLKKKTKTKRDSKHAIQLRDSAKEKIPLKDRKAGTTSSNSEYLRRSFSDGSNNVRLSQSGSVEGSIPSTGIGNNRLKNSDSYCNYQCSCRPSQSCVGKPAIDFNLLTHNGMPIKQIHQGRLPSYIISRNKIKQNEFNYTALDNLPSPPNTSKISSSSRNAYTSPTSFSKKDANESSRNFHLYQLTKCCNCQHTIEKCSSIENQSCKCNCIHCYNKSSTRTSPLISARKSFSSSQSCPQLDVINEEQAENEELANYINYQSCRKSKESNTRPKTHRQPIAADTLKKQKSLEDSCADFLNIVCDNILEAVQKSIDRKLEEYSSNVAEHFQSLGQKLEKSESNVKCLIGEIMDKMTEQNKNNLEQIHSLIQNLVENQIANQYAVTRNNCKDKECQYEAEIKEENEIIADVVQDVNNGKGPRAETTMDAKPQLCTCCHCNEINPTINEKSPKEESTNEDKNEHSRRQVSRNDAKPQMCDCCHCNEAISAKTLALHYSHSINILEEQIVQPLRPAEQNTHNAHFNERNKGGCTDCAKNKSVKSEDDIKSMRLSIKYPSQVDSLPRSAAGRDDLRIVGIPSSQKNSCVNNMSFCKENQLAIMELSKKYPAPEEVTSPCTLSAQATISQSDSICSQKSCSTRRDTSPQMFTTFSLTPSGKTIFNCNCSTKNEYSGSNKVNLSAFKGVNTSNETDMQLKLLGRNLYDNYETSGSATEPEDNNDPAGSSNACKNLQKKFSKQHCSSQTLMPVTLHIVNTASGQDNCKLRSGSQINRGTSKTNASNDSNASLTRLSRL